MADIDIGGIFLKLGVKSDGSILSAERKFDRLGTKIELTTQRFLKLDAADSKTRQGLTATSTRLSKAEADWRKLQITLGLVGRAEITLASQQKRLNSLLRSGTINAKQYATAMSATRTRLKAGGAAAGSFKLKMQELNKSVQIALGPLSGVAARITAFTGLVGQANLKIAALTGGLIGFSFALVKSIGQAVDFEAAMTGISKTTDITGGRLRELGSSLKTLSVELGESSVNLAKITETAGALGVRGVDNLAAFTEVIAKLGKATDLSGQTAAKQLVRLINVTTTSITEIGALGAVITGLGNQSAATEKEINKIAVEIGGATSAFRISAFEAEAFGAALASIGARAELSGSVMGRAFRAIDKSIRGGGQSMQFLSKLTGIVQKDLKKTFADAPATVFKLFLEGLNRLDTETGSVAQALEVFGLKGEEINKIIPALSQNIGLLEQAWLTMNKQIIEQNALNEETIRRLDTVAAKQDILRESIRNIAIEIGTNFLPASKSLLDTLNSFLANSGGIAKAFNAIGIALGSLLIAKLVTGALIPMAASLIRTGRAAKLGAIGINIFGKSIRLAIGPVGWFILAAEGAFFFGESLLKMTGIIKDTIPKVRDLAEAMAEVERLSVGSPDAGEERFEQLLTDLEKRDDALVKKRDDLIVAVGTRQRAGGSLAGRKNNPLQKALAADRADLTKVVAAIAANNELIERAIRIKRDQEELAAELDIRKAAGSIKLPEQGEKKKDRKIREKNAAVLESIRLIEMETVAILGGKDALKLFNEQQELEKEIKTKLKGLTQTSNETSIEFTARRVEVEERLRLAIMGRIEVEKRVISDESLRKAQDSIELLEEEIEAVKEGTEAYKTFKEEIKISKDVANFEKRRRDAGLEEDAIQRLTAAYEKLRRKLPEVQKELKKIEAENKKLDKLAENLAGSFQSAFEDAIAGGKSFSEVMRALEVDIIKVITRFLVIQPLIEALKNSLKSVNSSGGGGGFFGLIGKLVGGLFGGGGFSASDFGTGATTANLAAGFDPPGFKRGGIVGPGGRRQPFAQFGLGGAVRGIGLSPGQVPIIADEGETIRTPEQEKGIRARLAAAGGGTTIFNFNFPPGTDVRGFRKSLPQLGAEASRAIDRGKRNL